MPFPSERYARNRLDTGERSLARILPPRQLHGEAAEPEQQGIHQQHPQGKTGGEPVANIGVGAGIEARQAFAKDVRAGEPDKQHGDRNAGHREAQPGPPQALSRVRGRVASAPAATSARNRGIDPASAASRSRISCRNGRIQRCHKLCGTGAFAAARRALVRRNRRRIGLHDVIPRRPRHAVLIGAVIDDRCKPRQNCHAAAESQSSTPGWSLPTGYRSPWDL